MTASILRVLLRLATVSNAVLRGALAHLRKYLWQILHRLVVESGVGIVEKHHGLR